MILSELLQNSLITDNKVEKSKVLIYDLKISINYFDFTTVFYKVYEFMKCRSTLFEDFMMNIL